MGLIDQLGPGPVALDTPVFIYLFQEDSTWLPHLLPLFAAIDAGRRAAFTSAVTLSEVLVVPYRRRQLELAARYEALLTRGRGLTLVDITRSQWRAAARLRAEHVGLRTPDALQLVAAQTAGCQTLITNDRRLPRLPGLKVLQLSGLA